MGRGGKDTLISVQQARGSQQQVNIALADAADIPQLVALKTEVVREAFGELYPDKVEEYIAKNCTAKHFQYRIGRKGYYVLKAEDSQGNIVGVATLRPRGKRADSGGSGLYVCNRHQGIGSQLLKQREQLARQLGCQSARVTVFRTNTKAQQFVTSKGYHKTAGGFREPVFDVRVDYYTKHL